MSTYRIIAGVASGFIALGAFLATASAAEAQPIKESTIKSECKDAGGTYSTSVKGGTRFSTCSYRDISGDLNVDYYANGEYYSSWPRPQ